ncbi:general substrate transporter [Lichtheimia hyalospora FSU 10163]|nr:general substrate transporter [Lichtheimia hyalospora FSU 10163]
MSSILVNQRWLELFQYPDATMKGFIVAIFELGALVTSIVAGWVIDCFGRVAAIRIGGVIFIVGGTLQTASKNTVMLLLGRLIAGFGVGFFSTVIPMYVAELGRTTNRGRVSVFSTSIILIGLASSDYIGLGFSWLENHWSWRGPLLMQPLFAAILVAGTFFLPESPRYLIKKEQNDKAINVLSIIHDKSCGHPDVLGDYNRILHAVQYEASLGKSTWRELFTKYKRRSFLVMVVQTCVQLQGINYYAPIIYESVFGPGKLPLVMNGVSATFFVFGAWTCMFLVDRIGRRPFLHLVVWFAIMAVFTSGAVEAHVSQIMVIIYVSEIYPLRARARGMALASLTQWAWNFAVGLWTPPLLESIGYFTYIFYAVICFLTFVIMYFICVETKGKSLEEMDLLFGEASCVELAHANGKVIDLAAELRTSPIVACILM